MASQGRSIEAVVTLDLKPFQTKITEINTLLKELGNGINIDFGASKLAHQMDDLKRILNGVATEADKITTAFNKIEGMDRLLDSLSQVKSRLEYIQADIDKINASVIKTDEEVSKLNVTEERLNNIMNNGLKTLQSTNGQLSRASKESKGLLTVHKGVTDYFINEERIATVVSRQLKEESNILKEQERTARRIAKEAEGLLTVHKGVTDYFLNEEKISRMGLRTLSEKLKIQEQIRATEESDIAIEKGIATNVQEILSMNDKELAILREKLGIEEEILGVKKQQTAEEIKENTLQGRSGKNKLDKLGYLPSRIGSMAITMLGYQEIMDVWEKTTSNINAKTQFNTYAKMLKEDERYLKQTKQSTADVTKGIDALNVALTDTYKGGKSLQQMYSKVDMRQVGANALDTAFKYGVQAENLDELTEVMAIYSSEFVRQGRSQEDSILAVNDALDGEFRRLKEVNIGKEELEAHGYEEGNTLSLIRAMREIAEERGYDVTAQKITTLSEAINQAELELAFLLSDLFELVEPSLIIALGYVVQAFQALGGAVKEVKKYLKGLPQPAKDFLKNLGAGLMIGVVSLWVGSKVLGAIKNISLFGSAWEKLQGKLGKTKGMDKASESLEDFTNSTSGGTKDSKKGGFKEGFKEQWSKLGSDLGKMARIFVDAAVALAMAFVLIEEGILIISGIGATYEYFKPQFNQGIEFIKEFGIWFGLLGGAMLVLSYAIGKIPEGVEKAVTKGATRMAYGMAIAIGLVAEAIGLLIAPMIAIALLGGTASFLGTNLDKGLEVITWIGNALHQIDAPIALFIGGFLAISLLLGLVQPLTLALGVGIASSLLLVTEAIGLLILPLGAIALLGGTASMLGEENINQGAETIRLIGRVLKVLSGALVDLFIVDIATLGVNLANLASQLITGKTGLQSLVDDIIPDLTEFVQKFNALEMGDPVDPSKVAAVTQMATAIPPLFTAIQKVNNALGASDAIGNIMGGLGGSISGAIGMGLSGKLDQLYNDVKDVMEFAKKLGGLGTGENANTTAITQTANAIAQLKTKLNQFVATIAGAAARVQTASNQLGNALTNGFKAGSATFGATVIRVMTKGVNEIQSRYGTFHNAGKTLGHKISTGFESGADLKKTTSKELGYALKELDDRKSEFYDKGKALGSELTRGYEDGADIHSPGLIARTTARELRYTMDALSVGEKMLYQGGVALGQALTSGYNSAGNIRTDVGVLAQKGVNSEQLQAGAKNLQANANKKQQVQQLSSNTINIDMSNSTIIGIQDLDARIRESVERAIVQINSPNGAIGY